MEKSLSPPTATTTMESDNIDQLNKIIQSLNYQNDSDKQRFKQREQDLLDAIDEKNNEIKILRKQLNNSNNDASSSSSTSSLLSTSLTISSNQKLINLNSLLEQNCKDYENEIKQLKIQNTKLDENNKKLKEYSDELSYRIVALDHELNNFKNNDKLLNDKLKQFETENIKLHNEIQLYKIEKDEKDLQFLLKTPKQLSLTPIPSPLGDCKNDNYNPITIRQNKINTSSLLQNNSNEIITINNEKKHDKILEEINNIKLELIKTENSIKHEINENFNEKILSDFNGILKNTLNDLIENNEINKINKNVIKNNTEFNETFEIFYETFKNLQDTINEIKLKISSESASTKKLIVTTAAAASSVSLNDNNNDEKQQQNENLVAGTSKEGIKKRTVKAKITKIEKEQKILTEQLQNNDVSSLEDQIVPPAPKLEPTKVAAKKGRSNKKVTSKANTDENEPDDDEPTNVVEKKPTKAKAGTSKSTRSRKNSENTPPKRTTRRKKINDE